MKAQIPNAWQKIKIGQTISEVKIHVSDLKKDVKDPYSNTYFYSLSNTKSLAVQFQWVGVFVFNEKGHLAGVSARSYNEITGLFDSTFEL